MDFKRLFYINITYSCNNKCSFCISHNTRNRTKKVENPELIIKNIHKKFFFTKNDIFVINGGEPTVSPKLKEILDNLMEIGCKIIVYSNGRLLYKYKEFLCHSNIYWIIPFYGLAEIHDKYTRVKGSFLETLSSLKEIKNTENISVKFLIHEEAQIKDFFDLAEILKQTINEIHISFILNNNFSQRYILACKVNNLISYLQSKFVIKLSNIPLCRLNLEINFEKLKMNNIYKYYYIAENEDVKEIDYDKNHMWNEKCINCSLRNICSDTNKRYRVFKINHNFISLEEE